MNAIKRGGWALLGVGVVIALVAMGIDAYAGTSMLKDAAYIVTPIVGGGISLLVYGYRDLIPSRKSGEGE